MTVASRLARVEASLSPTALVVRWLAEAHAYDDLGSYSAALLDADPSTFPMDRLAREAKASATERTHGRPRAEADRAVRAAIIAAVFRVQLVLRINVLAADFVDREVLVQAALSAYLGLTVEGSASQVRDRVLIPVVRCRDLLLGRVTEFHAMETAHSRVEARFLGGAPALFPASQRRWEEQRTQSEAMAVIAMRLAELDGFDPPVPEDAAAVEARVEQLVADYLEPARSTAYNELGDGRRAVAVATRWLRQKLALGALVGSRPSGESLSSANGWGCGPPAIAAGGPFPSVCTRSSPPGR